MIKPKNWQPVIGDFRFESDRIIYLGSILTNQQTNQSYAKIGIALSDLQFNGGRVEMTVRYENATIVPSAHVVLYRNPTDGSLLTAGLDGGTIELPKTSRFSIVAYDVTRTGEKYQPVATTPVVERGLSGVVRLRVEQVGSVIDVFADDVLMLRHTLVGQLPRSQCGIYVSAANHVTIEDFRAGAKSRTAFVVMQFSPPYEDLFAEVIRPVTASCGLDVQKADETAGPGFIIADIVRRLVESDLVIADITPENQNVFYEVGYSHAIGKPTILLAEKGKKLPFDVSGLRVLFYENSIPGKAHLEDGLKRHIKAVFTDRPVSPA